MNLLFRDDKLIGEIGSSIIHGSATQCLTGPRNPLLHFDLCEVHYIFPYLADLLVRQLRYFTRFSNRAYGQIGHYSVIRMFPGKLIIHAHCLFRK